MEIIDCGRSGGVDTTPPKRWTDLGIEQLWAEIANVLSGSETARCVQQEAVTKVLAGRKNLIVSAPTNSGKSLVGDLALFQSILGGGRAVLVEPLRALAQEKYERFRSLQKKIEVVANQQFAIQISTGDYRLENEQFDSPPTDQAKLIITTPERLDAIARNPDFADWIDSIKALCVDEAHLISDRKRGPTIEYVLSLFRSRRFAPRLVLLSASVSETTQAASWLSPCESIVVDERYPPLHKQIIDARGLRSTDEGVVELLATEFDDPGNSFLVFVYQTRSAETLADRLCEILGDSEFAKPYHSKMSTAQRRKTRDCYETGATRCVVATTSLAMGVNLPATHVVVRDLLFHGEGRLSMPQLLQMCGRAGRGDMCGKASLVFHDNCGWELTDLANQYRDEKLPALVSSFQSGKNRTPEASLLSACEMVLKHLSRFPDGQTTDQIEEFFSGSLGGPSIKDSVRPAIQWLSDPCRILIGRNDADLLVATSLGNHAIRSTLPLTVAAGFGQLIRELLELDAEDRFLRSWSPLDHLIVLDLLSDRGPSLRRFSEHLAEQTTAWVEAYRGEKPILYREWIQGSKSHSKASGLLGSLGVSVESDGKARAIGYTATFRSIILQDRGNGIPMSDIERRWQIEDLVGVEEQWRDSMIWLLNALSRVLETRCFYFHLKESCNAGQQRIKRIERTFRIMRRQIYGLQEHLKYCSPLGGLLRSMKRTGKEGIGIQSIRKLESAGVQSVADLASWCTEDYRRLGLRSFAIKTIQSYLRRRRM